MALKLPRLPLHQWMLAGFLVGLAGGLAANLGAGPDAPFVLWLTKYVTGPIGQIFLRLLFMLVLPLLFAALTTGVAQMGDLRVLGRAGWKLLAITVAMSTVAVLIGLILVNIFKPGAGVDPELAATLIERSADNAAGIVRGASEQSGAQFFLEIIPSNVIAAAADNQILAVMAFALLFGVGLVLTKGPATQTLVKALEGLLEVMMALIGLVLKVAPIAVACLMFNLAALFGWDLLLRLGAFAGVVLLALTLHFIVVYSLVLSTLGGMSPWTFLRAVEPAIFVAFATSSSNATLPTSLHVAEERLKLPPQIGRFVLTVGATANQNGTALYEGVTVLFLAQFFGLDLGLGEQALVMAICILGGIGTAGVPSGSLPVIAMILGMVGAPPAGIGLILGIDRFLDMCRTVLNVVGDLVIAAVVTRGEKDRALPAA
jgi:DAACS family dicarboxylate/amino acid:cation (Na+ or H+) symporter